MSDMFAIHDLASLPDELRIPLLKGSVGKLHLLTMAEYALQRAGTLPAMENGKQSPLANNRSWLTAFGCETALAAWEQDILDGSLAGQLLALHHASPFLYPEVAATVKHVRANCAGPDNTSYLLRLLQRRETEKTCAYLEQQRDKAPSLYWTNQAMMVGCYEGRFDWLRMWIAADNSLTQGLRHYLLGNVALLSGKYGRAVDEYTQSLEFLPLAGLKGRLAEAHLRCGNAGQAIALWRELLVERPWHTNTLLRLHDVLSGIHNRTVIPEGQGAALFYTWNKAECLDMSLRCLADSELGETRIVVLDNGSTDSTPDVLAGWAGVLGSRMVTVRAPLNVGAPAARNWLMQLDTLADCRWLAYLDDDAMLPPDWLGRFGAAMETYPEAAAWGCKVVDYDNPSVLQAVDLHLDAGSAEQTAFSPYERRFSVTDLHHQDMDYGWFTYARPCVSVTGCTHMFLRDTLLANGGFDLRFSPSQYDDLEHDLRAVKDGNLPVYTGHLCVRHMKRTGKASHSDSVENSNAAGNMLKLQLRYTEEEFETMRQHEQHAALADMCRKYRFCIDNV